MNKGDWRFCCGHASSSSLVRLRGELGKLGGPGSLGKNEPGERSVAPAGGVLCAGAKQASHIRLGLLLVGARNRSIDNDDA